MASDIGVRFVLDAGNVDFYIEEILHQPLISQQRIDVQEHQITVPYVDVKGDIWQTMPITFLSWQADTRSKIAQLIDEEDEIVCYYAYKSVTTNKSLNCIYLPNGTTHSYKYYLGEPAARQQIKLTFIGSS